jgi:glycosyltransferase involved in cell wall biosynthesis
MKEGESIAFEGGLRTTGVRKQSLPGKPLISIVTVVFNGASTLEDTIRSVLDQAYSNYEYIIIDGGSTDKTTEIIRRYNDKVDYWLSEQDSGIYDAMNKGIQMAKGDYVGMINSDDFFSNSLVLDTIADATKSGQVDAVFSCLDIVDPGDVKRIFRRYRIKSFNSFMLRIGIMPPHPTFYCKKSCYERSGPYKTNYQIAADYEMMVRLLVQHKITWRFIDKTTIKMRSGGVSNRGLMSKLKQNGEIIRACRENGLYTNAFFLLLKIPIRLLEWIF